MDELANDLSCAMIAVDVNECEIITDRLKSDEETSPHKMGKDKCFSIANSDTNNTGSVISVNGFNKSKKSVQKSNQKRQNKPVSRSASILLRSQVLVLSDSDSDDFGNSNAGNEEDKLRLTTGQVYNCLSLTRKSRMKKHKRKKDEKEHKFCHLTIGQSHYNQYYGKRKRSTSVFANVTDDTTHTTVSGDSASNAFNQHQSMDCDDSSADSSSLSESEIESDQIAEADDEQSDFYEVISRSNKEMSAKSFQKGKLHHSVPIPRNPFASVPSTPSSSFNSMSSSSAALLWKRRRRNH
ncbi:hypothetical protein B4U80_05187 [Leptotrombidium deliense]|uniref:Uncharacterized protein n=1 Tax=Leptotrombidium deliense TaxID=299467 RepID=A0A443SJ65_9ACAR|nr:hypothetical protein B4U80_05187 [Leptotrombidium deliense]